MTSRHVLIGPANPNLGGEIARLLGVPSTIAEERVFPDGETNIRAPLPEGIEELFIVQGTHPPQDRRLVQLLQMIDIGRHAGAGKVVCVVPYLAYGRQDRRGSVGEALSAKLVLTMIAAAGADALVTFEAHNPAVFAGHRLPVTDLKAQAVFTQWLQSGRFEKPVLVSPDEGGRPRVERLAEALGWPSIVLDKHKSDDGCTWYDATTIDLTGRDVIVLDDLCSTGSTLLPLAAFLRTSTPKSLTFGIVHFFADEARLREKLGDVTIRFTDTVPQETCLEIASYIASALLEISEPDCVAEAMP